jgi:hypothetical protein
VLSVDNAGDSTWTAGRHSLADSLRLGTHDFWHVHCSIERVPIRGSNSQSQQFDDRALFLWLTLIIICCGPPAGR